jgi:hypothetical protein
VRKAPLLILVLLLPGCGTPATPQPGSPTTADPFAHAVPPTGPPKPFAENHTELEALGDFLRNAIPALRCLGPNRNGVAEALQDQNPMGAVSGLYTACADPAFEASTPMALRAIENGTENATFLQLQEKALAAQRAADEALDSIRPTTLVGLELQERLIAEWEFNHSNLRLASMQMEAYWNTQSPPHRRSLLTNGFLQLMVPALEANVTLYIVQNYPNWQNGDCPVIERLRHELPALAHQALALANRVADPEDAEFIDNPYGATRKLILPVLNATLEHGWNGGIMGAWARLKWNNAYFENMSSPLPDQQQTVNLLEQYRRHTRTGFTEREVLSLIQSAQYESPRPWEERGETVARLALTVSALPPFPDCSGRGRP